ncbi:hypothetical protein ACW4TU_04570 [Streptomyces sp. QTS52]
MATVRDLMDDPGLWERTVGVLVRNGLGTDPARLARRLEPYLDVPARELPTLANKVLFEDGGAGAAADLEALLSSATH